MASTSVPWLGYFIWAALVVIIFVTFIWRLFRRQRRQDAAMNKAPGDTWPCPVCCEHIPKGARKCVKCQSELRWRKYLVFGNTTLALITALISVIITSAPTIKSMFEWKDSHIDGVYVGATHEGALSLIVGNDGTRPGAVKGGRLVVAWDRNDGFHHIELKVATPNGLPVFISARSTKQVVFNVTHDLTPDSDKITDAKPWATKLRSLPPVWMGHSFLLGGEKEDISCFVYLDVVNAKRAYEELGPIVVLCQDVVDVLLETIEGSSVKAK